MELKKITKRTSLTKLIQCNKIKSEIKRIQLENLKTHRNFVLVLNVNTVISINEKLGTRKEW